MKAEITYSELYFAYDYNSDTVTDFLADKISANDFLAIILESGMEPGLSEETPPYGSADDRDIFTVGKEVYIVSWNSGLGYAAITLRETKNQS